MSDTFDAGVEEETRVAIKGVEGFRAAGVGHVVYTSAASADRDTGVPHYESKRRVEHYLREQAVPHTVIGPAFFMENRFFGLRRIDDGWILPSPMPVDRQLQQIPVDDIGAFARHVFLSTGSRCWVSG
ncbi:NmrA family NAD(P)-binding protein [Fodinicola feengrottensis]|uniref:NmrA family NAD(P)-binding protein n=1 Tax=Fodinicola feengrottensis TaxID=435914 RepID=UPI0024416C4E|nr:NmrA family NAD(P)-binding protein [Fodinicola feengrottensis]